MKVSKNIKNGSKPLKKDKKQDNKAPFKPRNKTTITNKFIVKSSCGLMDFLMENLKGKSRNNIKSLLSHHEVLVDGTPISQFDFMLAKGDEVSISSVPVKKIEREVKREKLDILYEDDDIIAINKPSGLLSIASDNESSLTAYRLITDHVREKDPHNRIYVVHRIDKDTSGVLIACKNEELRDALQDVWNDVVTDRGYYAIVEGQMEEKEGTIKSWLRKAEKTNLMYSAKKMGDGKLSITHYKQLKTIGKVSLLEVHIDSGRKNQIRVHMKENGHSIIGDETYGCIYNPLKRLGLHAYCLEFKNPLNNKTYKFKTKLPKECPNRIIFLLG